MAERPKIILAQTGPGYTPWNVRDNIDHLETLPYDGYRIGSFDGERLMRPANEGEDRWRDVTVGELWRVDYDDAIAQYKGLEEFNATHHNYLSIKIGNPGGPGSDGILDDDAAWAQVAENFKTMAQVAKDAGFKGIFFDNEEYAKDSLWLNHASGWDRDDNGKHDLIAAQNLAADRGRQIGAAMQEVFPDMSFAIYHSNAGSVWTPDKPAWMGDPNNQELRGPFSAGIMEGLGDEAHLADLGEDYRLRTDQEFRNHAEFRDMRLSDVMPWEMSQEFRENYGDRVDQGHMTYTHPTWGGEMSPEIMVDVMLKSLLYGEGLVAAYTSFVEGSDAGGNIDLMSAEHTNPAWTNAIREAISIYDNLNDPNHDQFSVYLMDAQTDVVISEIKAGDVIDIGDADRENLTIVVKTDDGRTQSISMLNNGVLKNESMAPYAYFGDDDEDGLYGGAFDLGPQVLQLTAHTEASGAGYINGFTTFHFELIDSDGSSATGWGDQDGPSQNGDIFTGEDISETVDGGAGQDALYGGGGADKLYGGKHNDLLVGLDDGEFAADYLDGGEGNDRYRVNGDQASRQSDIVKESGVGIGYDVIEAFGSFFEDVNDVGEFLMIADHALRGTDGTSELHAGDNAPFVRGSTGNDLIYTGGGDTIVYGSADTDYVIFEGTGNGVTLRAAEGDDTNYLIGFDDTRDRIDLSSYDLGMTADAIFNNMIDGNITGSAMLKIEGSDDTLVFVDLTLSDLSADIFIV